MWAWLAVLAAVASALLAGTLSAPAEGVALLGSVVARVVMDVAGVGCVGAALMMTLLPTGPDAAALRDTAARVCVWLGAAWLASTLLAIAFRTAVATGGPVADVGWSDVVVWSSALAAGRGTLLAAACAAAVVACAVRGIRRPERVPVRALLSAALLGLLGPAVTGHTGADGPSHTLAFVMTGLHVTAAALWVGGLGGLLVLVRPRPALLTAALPRFSRVAAVCIVAVAVSGVVSAVLRLPDPGALLITGFGWLIVVKAGLLVVLGALGALVRSRLVTGRASVPRWAGTEIAVMSITIGVAATLSQSG